MCDCIVGPIRVDPSPLQKKNPQIAGCQFIHDLALPLAKLRIRARGSAGGHNGLASIVNELGGEDFARLRIGIAWVEGRRMVSHVLGEFSSEEEPEVRQAIERAADAAATAAERRSHVAAGTRLLTGILAD